MYDVLLSRDAARTLERMTPGTRASIIKAPGSHGLGGLAGDAEAVAVSGGRPPVDASPRRIAAPQEADCASFARPETCADAQVFVVGTVALSRSSGELLVRKQNQEERWRQEMISLTGYMTHWSRLVVEAGSPICVR